MSVRLRKNDPSVSFADSSPYAGEPMGCGANLYRTIGKRQFCGFVSPLDTGLTQALYQYSVRAPPKSLPCVRGGGSALAEPVGLFFICGFTFYQYTSCDIPTGERGGNRGKQNGKDKLPTERGARSAPHLREAAVLRCCRQFRYRADAISVSVAASVRL